VSDRAITADEQQYELRRIVAVWAFATVPMAILVWGITPLFDTAVVEAFIYVAPPVARFVMETCGLVWAGVVCAVILRIEVDERSWRAVADRAWLHPPSTETKRGGALWLIVLAVIVANLLVGFLPLAPFDRPDIADPSLLARSIEGDRRMLGVAVVHALFLVTGQALLFYGILLPKMSGVFGRYAWAANAILFGLFHLHEPWTMPSAIVMGAIVAFAVSRFRSAWLALIPTAVVGVFTVAIIRYMVTS
jgi:uncharacterized protein